MTGTSRRSSPAPHPSHFPSEGDSTESWACTGCVREITTQVGSLRAKKWELSCQSSEHGDKLFTGRLYQGSVYGMQAMRSGSLAVKSHQRRLLGLSGVKLSLSTRRWAAGSPSVTKRTTSPYMDPLTGITVGRFVLVFLCSFCLHQQVVSPPWADGYYFGDLDCE